MKFPIKNKHRLSRKFIVGVVLILLFVLAGTFFVNSQVVERFYLYEQYQYIQVIGNELENKIDDGYTPQQAIEELEEREKVLIVYTENTGEADVLANELRESFKEKGLGFQKFWLWDEDYKMAVENGSQFRLYSQNKMNYSILVQYLTLESGLYAIAAIVPDAQGVINLVNHISFLIYALAILVAIILIFILTKHITKPLEEMQVFTRKIASQTYQPLQIKTVDELEDVANSLNDMANEIERYQKKLEEKNSQMKQLLNDVAHDLKTPISLVGMYARGIKDGLDDGTFLDTIIRQNEKMSQFTEKLLHFSRIEQKEYDCEELELDQILRQCMAEQKLFFEQRGLLLSENIEPHLKYNGNKELLWEMFSNLLSNAAKYATSGSVEVELLRKEQTYFFCITNEMGHSSLDIAQIWQPFYVGESSRNKGLSGTGLGLSIVKKIAERFHYEVSCSLQEQKISFEVVFPIEK